MKANQKRKRARGFTLVELFVIVALLFFLTLLVPPAFSRGQGRARRIQCANNLKQVGLAYEVWALGNGGLLPMQVGDGANAPPNLAQLMQANPMPVYTYQVFGVMSNELGSPKVLVCPADDSPVHTNFLMVQDGTNNQPFAGQTTLCNLNLSYFVGRGANEETPQSVLMGDRNIYGGGSISQSRYDSAANGGFGNSPVHAGVTFSPGFACAMGTNFTAGGISPCWTDKMHQKQGNVALADGSVQLSTSSVLRSLLAGTGDTNVPPNMLLFP